MKSIEEHYHPQEIESHTQKYWDDNGLFNVQEDSDKDKFYCLSMFPYPSGQLHMGHVRNYTIGDVIARYQRMLGKNVLQPMGWDAFGLPAENAAIKHQVAPAKWTYENIDYMRDQLKRLGFAYDWTRELATCDPKYYRWEQWLFTKLIDKGLVYKKTAPVNWCPQDKTVLANEQVIDGRCWRCDTLVEKQDISQWFMKITAYAEELLDDLDKLQDWPEKVVTMQKNWIGRSKGVELSFAVEGDEKVLKVFTTRPDTLMGVTYVAVAPDHPLTKKCAQSEQKIQDFANDCRQISTAEADMETMEKKGIDLGIQAIHPISGKRVPIYAANFVLLEYGEGAVMSVPAHDQRDWEFAHKYNLPIQQVIAPEDGSDVALDQSAFVEKGVLISSGEFDGLSSQQAFDAIATYLSKMNRGQVKINYRLRDWGISRQRYWGAPIPIINCDQCGSVSVPEKDLPVVLPEDVEIDGSGSPLKNMPSFYETNCPKCGGKAQRETDTFDTFMESSWYFARFTAHDNDQAMLDPRANYWLPVDQYVGGIEHAILHLLYARFYNKLLRDAGLITIEEPMSNLLTQGMVLKDGTKMSKSKGNTVDPQPLIDKYGADTVRLFTMFAAPPEHSLEWNDAGVEGAYRFLKKLWRLISSKAQYHALQAWYKEYKLDEYQWESLPKELAQIRSEIHTLLTQANRDVVKYQFNTVISAAMKMINSLQPVVSMIESNHAEYPKAVAVLAESIDVLLRLLGPIVPHITHELWYALGRGSDLLNAKWPQADSRALQTDSVQLVVQVNGKLRSKIEVDINLSKQEIESQALADENVQRFTQDKQVVKIIVVPKRLVNIVVK